MTAAEQSPIQSVSTDSPGKIQEFLHKHRKSIWGLAFISPFYISFAIFGLYPLLFSIVLSLNDWKGRGPMEFVNLDNFLKIFQGPDKVFWQSITNGFILFVMYVPIMIFLALVLAVILNSGRVKGFRLFRTIIFLPFITNMVAAGFAFRLLLESNDNGFFNIILRLFGAEPYGWLESEWGARISLSLLIIWAWLGYNMVIMLAGLQTIPKDLNDAAKVDGAGPIQTFFRITIPLMRPVILFVVITSTIGSFGLFAEITTLTGGGPANATVTPLVHIYGVAFDSFKFGYASALAYVFFAIIFVFTLMQLRFNRDVT